MRDECYLAWMVSVRQGIGSVMVIELDTCCRSQVSATPRKVLEGLQTAVVLELHEVNLASSQRPSPNRMNACCRRYKDAKGW